MGVLDKYKGKIGDSEVFGRSKYFPNEGQFEVLVKKCKGVNGKKGVSFVIECEVTASTNEELAPGDIVGHVCKLGGEFGYGEQDIKRFVCQMNGIDPSAKDAAQQVLALDPEMDEEDPITAFAQQLIDLSEAEPLDISLAVKTWPHVTKNNKTVTRLEWAPIG